MRTPPEATRWRPRLSTSAWIIVINVLFYAAQLVVPLAGGGSERAAPHLETYLALYPGDLLKGYLWQLVTFQLLHGGILHITLNCAMLYMFGRPVEDAIGRVNFLILYFGSGAFGGLVQAGASLMFPTHFGYLPGFGFPPVVGASAGVFGLIAAFALLNAELPITTLIAFIIPVTMRAKYLIVAELLVAVFGILHPVDNVAHAAHLGGILAGLAYVRFGLNRQHRSFAWSGWRVIARRRPELVKTPAARSAAGWQQPAPPTEEIPPAEFISKEVDPILDKISAHGIQSLTPRERRILELAREKMRHS